MKSGIVICDVDGVLTRDHFSRFGGIGLVGRVVWWGLRGIGVAECLMHEAVPDVLAREWIHHLRSVGYQVHLRTG